MNNKPSNKLPKWDKTQIDEQKKINKRLTIRTIITLIAVFIVIIVAIVVSFASCNKDGTPKGPGPDASAEQIEAYLQNKFADNNAASIDQVQVADKTKILMVKLNNVDVSSGNSSANSFSQLADELQAVCSYDLAKKGVIFYGVDNYQTATTEKNKLSFAVYFNQSNINSLNSDYSDYIQSGNYPELFENANGYYLYELFRRPNKKFMKLPATKSERIISESVDGLVK